LINTIIHGVTYKFEKNLFNLPKETEIRVQGTFKLARKNGVSKPFLIRNGLPQGLSFSPILATLVLELIPAPEGLIMCADDGLIITDEIKKREVEE